MQASVVKTKSRTRKTKSMKAKKVDPNDSKPASTAKNPPPTADKNKTHECDFDDSPTKLYLFIQQKKWEEAIARARSHSVESRTWITRKEDSGKLRWRLLPLHASLIFKAPEKVIESLLVAFPLGAQCKDDQGMIPLHLAFRNAGTEITVNMLICAYPKSVEVTDRKGRLPYKLAQGAPSPQKEMFINALQRAPVYYSVAAQSCAEVGVYNSPSAKRIVDAEKLNLMGKLETMTMEWQKAEQNAKALAKQLNTIQAELTSKVDMESGLTTKIDALEAQVEELTKTKESNEAELTSTGHKFEEERFALLEKVELQRSLLEEKEKSLNSITETKFETKHVFDDRFDKLESDRASAMANAAVLEAQLRQKTDSEHALSSQVSDLATKLAESATKSCQTAEEYMSKIEALENEKVALKHNLSEVTSSLFQTLKNLDNMTKEQERILEVAAKYEESMAKAMEDHERIASWSDKQEQIMTESRLEREEMLRILSLQTKNAEKIHLERVELGQEVGKQKEYMTVIDTERQIVVESITKQRSNMANVKNGIKDLYKVLVVDDEDVDIDVDTDNEGDEFNEKETIEKDDGAEDQVENEIKEGEQDGDNLEDEDDAEYKDILPFKSGEVTEKEILLPPRPNTGTSRSASVVSEVTSDSSKQTTSEVKKPILLYSSSDSSTDSDEENSRETGNSSRDSSDDRSRDSSGDRSRESSRDESRDSSRERSQDGGTILVTSDSVEIEATQFVP